MAVALSGDGANETRMPRTALLSRFLLAEAIWNAPKRGFNNPLSELLRGALRPLAESIFANSPDLFAPYLQPDAVRALWREHADLETNHAYALWPLLTFALWRSELEGGNLAS